MVALKKMIFGFVLFLAGCSGNSNVFTTAFDTSILGEKPPEDNVDAPSTQEENAIVPAWNNVLRFTAAATGDAEGKAMLFVNDQFLITAGTANNGTSDSGVIKRYDLNLKSFDIEQSFQLETGSQSVFTALAKSLSGALFVTGFGRQSGSLKSVLFKSTDNGQTWALQSTFQLASGKDSISLSITADSFGNLYWAHSASDGASKHWVIQKSTNDGTSWSTLDDFQQVAALDAEPNQIQVISNQVIVVGKAVTSNSKTVGIVRLGSNLGSAWQTSLSFPEGSTEPATSAEFKAFAINSKDAFYVLGKATINGSDQFILRKSTNSGGSWSTVLSGQLEENQNATGTSLVIDSQDTLYLGGSAIGEDGVSHWFSSFLSSDEQVFAYIDNFQLEEKTGASLNQILRINDSHFFAIGSATNSFSQSEWVLRELL